jgi:hypothetical protein
LKTMKAHAGVSKRNAAKDESVVKLNMSNLRDELKKLGLATSARSNDRIGYYVVEVTPTQLNHLSKVDAVQAIRPNRLRRV